VDATGDVEVDTAGDADVAILVVGKVVDDGLDVVVVVSGGSHWRGTNTTGAGYD
jgi:hypothetical protein